MPNLTVSYFASLREQSGLDVETFATSACTPAALYEELQARFGFEQSLQELRVAVDESFAAYDTPLADGQHVVFIPPVSGG